jgi:serine O-acetyltransferase
MWRTFIEDLEAVRANDPAAHSAFETLLCHTPLHALLLHRIAHALHARLGLPLVPRLLSVLARFWTGVEIHPAARIGRRCFIDHGTGVVIGETAEIGDDCVMFHNVTLGGTGKLEGKRHPTVKDNVFIGTGATLLGPITVGSNAKIGANAFVRMHDVPASCTAAGTPARIVKRDGRRTDEALPRTRLSERSIPVPISNERPASATGGSDARSGS